MRTCCSVQFGKAQCCHRSVSVRTEYYISFVAQLQNQTTVTWTSCTDLVVMYAETSHCPCCSYTLLPHQPLRCSVKAFWSTWPTRNWPREPESLQRVLRVQSTLLTSTCTASGSHQRSPRYVCRCKCVCVCETCTNVHSPAPPPPPPPPPSPATSGRGGCTGLCCQAPQSSAPR